MENKFRAARKASDMTLNAAAEACGVSKPTYAQHEQEPKDFRLSEIRGLYSSASDTAKPILLEGVTLFIRQ